VSQRKPRKTVQGVVTSDRMDKTITVAVERQTQHPKYGKRVRRRSRFYAHDEANEARVGDRVELMQTRPLSKNKRWRLTRIVERA